MLEHVLVHALARYETRLEGEIGVRSQQCARCGAAATLRTARVRKRLRLCLAFVVPLGTRVQVDHCSECGKSAFDVSVQTWERLRVAAFAAARAEIARPDARPERWLDEHRARAVFGDEAGASDLAHQLAGDPRATARLHAELALTQQWLGHHGSAADSMRAAAKRCSPGEEPLWGLGLEDALDEGDVDTALQCLEKYGVLGDLRQGAMRQLIRLLVERRRARQLSEFLGRLLQAFPHAAYDVDVRRAARWANRRLDGARPIVLPRLPGEHRTRNVAATAAFLVVALFVAAELHARFARQVWLVSTRDAHFDVVIDAVPVAALHKRATERIDLAYGTHEMTITGAREACFELVIEPQGVLALLDDRIHVVDVAGDAILRVTPPGNEHGEPSAPARIVYGREVHAFDGVERAFGASAAPAELRSRAGARGSTLEIETRNALSLAMEDASAGRNRAALALLADRIARDPARDDLDLALAWTAAECGSYADALAALSPKLALTPLAVRAHDAARFVLEETEPADRLRADYERRHAASPLQGAEGARERSTAALLRAHLCAERAEAERWLALAREADPRDVRVLRHSADLAAGVEWNAALAFALAGLAIEPHDGFMLDVRSGARMALGQANELERELRAELVLHPRDQERQGRLAELFVVTNRSTELDLFVGEAERLGGGPQRAQRLRVLALEAGGRLEELAASPFDPRDEARTRWQVLALCELGRAREFGERLGKERRVVDRWYDALAIDLCFRLVDDEARARPWRGRALHRLARHSAQARVAELLRAEEPATPETIARLALGAHETAVVLLAEAERARGAQRAALLDAAARFHPWPGHVQRLARRLAADS